MKIKMIHVCMCVCKYLNLEKQGILRMILFIVEVFANVKHFDFYINVI